MSASRKHILYIAEFSTGGSVESLLCLVGGLNQEQFKATVLFYSLPDGTTCDRFEKTGASICSLYPRRSAKGRPQHLKKHNLQSKIRKFFGRRVERTYESLKEVLHFFRFRMPIYKAIREQIDRIQPDLVHLNNGAGSDAPGILAARAQGVPSVCHVRTFGNLTYAGVAAARSVSVFLCISSAVRETLIGYGIESGRCLVVPNAVDLDRFNAESVAAADIHQEFGWDRQDKVFALVGRVVSWKGQDIFIRAVAEAQYSDASIRGLIVGDGEESPGNAAYLAGLRSLIAKYALEDIVQFSGHRADVANIMKSANAVVCASSLPEPFGRVIIESMAVGTPVVATNAGGTPDIIADGDNGLLVPIKDSEALTKAMLRLSQDSELAMKLKSAATQTVGERYAVAHHVETICDIYGSLLNPDRRPPR